jgi:hypothetical protein
MIDYQQLKPVGETYKITIGTTVTSLPTPPDGTVQCRIQVESFDVRVKFNATDSTTYGVTGGVGGGFIMFVNSINNPWYVIEGYDRMARARFKSSTGGTAYINVVFEGYDRQTTYLGGLA